MKPSVLPVSTEDTSRIQQAVAARAIDGKLGCTTAFSIAAELNVPPMAVGQTLDQLDCRITQCQLGLFGYSPQKKIVIPEKNIDTRLKTAIEEREKGGYLTCLDVWSIAESLQLSKIMVSNACEGMGLKIKPCQLGAF